jgi:sphinganine-1-phosphate aldolase
MPGARQKVESQMNKAKLDIEDQLVPKGPNVVRHLTLPESGKSLEWILAEMDKMDNEHDHNADWRLGKLSGAVYRTHCIALFGEMSNIRYIDGGDDLENIIVNVYKRYLVSNPLHPTVFPAVRKMEAEIVAMCLQLYNNPSGAGIMTSGGTESIIMAIKTYRDWAREVKGIMEPEM